MESEGTKNKLEWMREITRNLADAKSEIAGNIEAAKMLMGASVDLLLAGEDYLTWDAIQQLKDVRGLFVDEDSETAKKSESEADAAIEEVVADSETFGSSMVHSLVADIEKLLANTTAKGQEEVLAALQASQPQRTADYEAEEACDEARDNLINYLINNLSLPAQTRFYKLFRIAAEDKGEEILTEAA